MFYHSSRVQGDSKLNKVRIAYDGIEKCLIEGMTDKIEIYNKVESTLNIPRPTIRQACKLMRRDYTNLIKSMETKK